LIGNAEVHVAQGTTNTDPLIIFFSPHEVIQSEIAAVKTLLGKRVRLFSVDQESLTLVPLGESVNQE
jgi:hypothetical protein